MNDPVPYTQPVSYNQVDQDTATPVPTKHECNCAPDAPCRVTGKCVCMNKLQKILTESEVKNE